MLDQPPNALTEFLRHVGHLYKEGDFNVPYAIYKAKGWYSVKTVQIWQISEK
jgi:phage antirepressor YoqD-like protein